MKIRGTSLSTLKIRLVEIGSFLIFAALVIRFVALELGAILEPLLILMR